MFCREVMDQRDSKPVAALEEGPRQGAASVASRRRRRRKLSGQGSANALARRRVSYKPPPPPFSSFRSSFLCPEASVPPVFARLRVEPNCERQGISGCPGSYRAKLVLFAAFFFSFVCLPPPPFRRGFLHRKFSCLSIHSMKGSKYCALSPPEPSALVKRRTIPLTFLSLYPRDDVLARFTFKETGTPCDSPWIFFDAAIQSPEAFLKDECSH